jgi:hypothetical protein
MKSISHFSFAMFLVALVVGPDFARAEMFSAVASVAHPVVAAAPLKSSTPLAYTLLPNQLFLALPGEIVPALPHEITRALPGQLVRSLPGQMIRALPGQIVRPLPGQLVQSLSGQIVR